MRFAIVVSGGKQYRAVEGQTIDVDRLSVEAGKKFDFERVLLMSDGDDIMVGTPLVSGIEVKATVVDHVKGPKIDRLRYRPKKRIRVRGGHRQQYTRILVDFIGRPGEERKTEKAEPKPKAEKAAPAEPKEEAAAPKAAKQPRARKETAKPSTKKAPAKSTTTKKTKTTKSSPKK